MNRRNFLVGASALTVLAALPISAAADVDAAKFDLNTLENAGFDSIEPVFKNKLVTVMGSSKKETCEEYVGRFFSAWRNSEPYPTFSFGDAYFTDVIRATRPAENYHLISFVGDAASWTSNDGKLDKHLRAAMKHDPEMLLIEHIAGRHAIIEPSEFQRIVAVGKHVTGGVHAETLPELFEAVAFALGDETSYLTAGNGQLQVFRDMNDVTDQFVQWLSDQKFAV